MAPARLDGAGVLQQADIGGPAWNQTVFLAASAAADGKRWDTVGLLSEGLRRDAGHARTQGRYLELAGKLAGIHVGLSEQQREAVAQCLDVPLLHLNETRARWQSGDWTHRGKGILETLAAIPVKRTLPERLLNSGALVGLWPAVHRWRSKPGVLVRSELWIQSVSTIGHGPDPPSTNLQRQG
jgi:hypothetical protein